MMRFIILSQRGSSTLLGYESIWSIHIVPQSVTQSIGLLDDDLVRFTHTLQCDASANFHPHQLFFYVFIDLFICLLYRLISY